MLFKGKYAFLSNFTYVPSGIRHNDIEFKTVENAYQAAKCKHREDMQRFAFMSPGDAKRQGRKVTLRDDWENVKDNVMYDLLSQKFENQEFAEQLKATGNIDIIETNFWHDNYWGLCLCPGCRRRYKPEDQNHLGKILMKIRSELKDNFLI